MNAKITAARKEIGTFKWSFQICQTPIKQIYMSIFYNQYTSISHIYLPGKAF